MGRWLKFYRDLAYNVLILAPRGHGISGGRAATANQELEAYYDVEAALKFVISNSDQLTSDGRLLPSKTEIKDLVVAHGHSLGGAYAAALGYFCGVKNVILDHTFTTFSEVASNLTKVFLSKASVEGAVNIAFPCNEAPKDNDVGVRDFKTDRWDSLAKVKGMEGEIFVIRGETDRLMKKEFGDQFVQGRYPGQQELQDKRLATVKGGHNEWYNFFSDEGAQNKLKQFLRDRGLPVGQSLEIDDLEE